MVPSKALPARPHLGYLKDLAKKELASLRAERAGATLAMAQLKVARGYGFGSWRALKAEVDRVRRELGDAAEKGASADGEEAFFQAALAEFRSGTLARAEELLRANRELGTGTIYGACVTGNERRIRELLAEKPFLAGMPGGPRGWEPLLYLCFSRWLRLKPRSGYRFARCARLLLAHGADANAYWMHGEWRETASYGASGIANCAPVTQVLLEAGADPGKPDLETLYHTAEFRDHRCLKLVLGKIRPGEWLNYCMGHQMDAEDPAGLRLFLERGADPNFLHEKHALAGKRPLHFAILRHRSAGMVRMLLEAGADANLPDGNGVSPLALARRLGHGEAVRVLREVGAVDTSGARDEVMAAVMAGDGEGARRLMGDVKGFAAGLSMEEQGLLPHAAEAGNLAAVRLMLELGWDVETEGAWKGTALHQAVFHGHLDVVKLLLKRGARIGHKNGFGGSALGTAVHAAIHEGHATGLEILKLIGGLVRNRSGFARYVAEARAEGKEAVARVLERVGEEMNVR